MIRASEMLNKPRYMIMVNGYQQKGSFKKKKDALRMFRILKGICERGTYLELWKGWIISANEEESIKIKECLV